MGTFKGVLVKLSDPRPSSFIELPPGTHIIADKKYTVVEITEESYDGESYTRNVIDLIEPATPVAPVV